MAQKNLEGSKEYSADDKVAIIGGGASGLASAYFLIKAGHKPDRISIFEQNDRLGGHARTIYLHRVSDKELYVIKDYEMTFGKDNQLDDIFLEFQDHEDTPRRVQVNKNPDIVPVDIGVCGFSKNYTNFNAMLRDLRDNKGIPFFQFEYLEFVSRSIHLQNNLILRSDRPAAGQLFRPWNWIRLLCLSLDIDKIVNYCDTKGVEYLRTISIKTLLSELQNGPNVSQDGLDVLTAFCKVGSGYSNEQFAEISALYLYDFFNLGNFKNFGEENTIWQYGVSAYVYKLANFLEEKGVNFVNEEVGKDAKHTIYAIQPYDAKKINPALPTIESTRSILYVHCNSYFQGNSDTVLTYGKVKGIESATWDLDRMRPDIPDCGAFVTFTIPEHESEIDALLSNKTGNNNNMHLLNEIKRNGHNLCEAPLKNVWTHAFIDVPSEEKRSDIWANHQGKDGKYYCSSSYRSCMLHENAISCALDVVCIITGAHSKLSSLGFKPSSSL